MFGKLFLKEWKEKISLFIFPFIFMFIFAVVILVYPSQKFEVIEYLSWAMFLFFLPFTALLLGASGFQSEFKDDAWAYLFSRPIKKWKIWVIKYFSHIAILLSILLIFRMIIFVLPGLKEVMKASNFYIDILGSDSFFSSCLVLSLSAFTISFSLSFLYEKQFIILFVSILIGSGLAFVSYKHFVFLEEFYPFGSGPGGFYIFIALSFVAASILTFIKSDFSQAGKRIWLFSKFVLLFLAISFSTGTIWTLTARYEYISSLHKYEGNVYFGADNGIFRYLPKLDKLEKIIKSDLIEGPKSIRGGKVAFLKYKGRKLEGQELWIMNTDGSQKNCVGRIGNVKDSPFYDSWLDTYILSQDGKKIAFIASKYDKQINDWRSTLWWVNSDGTGLKGKILDFPYASKYELIAWPEFDNSLIILVRDYQGKKILKFNLESETHQFVAQNLSLPPRIRIHPRHSLIAFLQRGKAGQETLSVLDLRTLDKKEVYEADTIDRFVWSNNGDKIAFLAAGNELIMYNFLENNIKKIEELNYTEPGWYAPDFDFVLNDKEIVAGDIINGELYLRIFGDGFKEKKQLKIPFHLEDGKPWSWGLNLRGLNNIVLVHSSGKNELWRLNLDTEKWRKIYH